jgi:endonuclease/exonuclease/phosphatase family metal-dependent hydrolase
MTGMTILTANIAYGFAGMDQLFSSVTHQVHIHGWGILTYEYLPVLRGKIATVSTSKRVDYVRKQQNLEPTLELVRRTCPDILVLNETIYEIYRDELEFALSRLGFETVAWGVSTHYPGTTISTLVATKRSGTAIPCTMPQRPSMGGGAGMAGIRLSALPLSVFGVHLTYRSPTLFKRQVSYIAKAAALESAQGREVILAGDWNECEAEIFANPQFRSLQLTSAALKEDVTCPTFLPHLLRKPLDHVFIPSNWHRSHSEVIGFGSDHLALIATVEPEVAAAPHRNIAALRN